MSACDNDLKISAFSDMLVHNKATVCVLIKKNIHLIIMLKTLTNFKQCPYVWS